MSDREAENLKLRLAKLETDYSAASKWQAIFQHRWGEARAENAQLKARVAELETALGGLSHGFAPDEGPHADLYSADERRPCFCPWHRHTEATHTPQCLAARAALTGARKRNPNE